MEPVIAERLLASIDAGRLMIICGAGLSIADPSAAPSARQLAHQCAERYRAVTGQEAPEAESENLERLAEHFLFSPPLRAEFLNRFVDWSLFNGKPNPGHFAIADFLGCGAAEAAITTNFDAIIEEAAHRLGEPDFHPAVEEGEVNQQRDHKHLLKIHGCMKRNRSRTVWCHRQINGPGRDEAIFKQLQLWRAWLVANLRGKDLVVVGFWSDWSYLNDVLANVLQGSEPQLMYLIDRADPHDLEAKAPGLWGLAQMVAEFRHIQQCGAEFLFEFRKLFNKWFFESTLRRSVPTYQGLTGNQDAPQIGIQDDMEIEELYALRRDLCGVPPNRIVRYKRPQSHMEMVGAIHLLVQNNGATLKGSRYTAADGRKLRVVCGGGRALSQVKKELSVAQGQSRNDEIVISDAAKDGNAPEDLVRGQSPATVVRAGSEAEWLTFPEARQQGYC